MSFQARNDFLVHEAFLKVWINLALPSLETFQPRPACIQSVLASFEADRIAFFTTEARRAFNDHIRTAEQRANMVSALEGVRLDLKRRPPVITREELRLLMHGDPQDEIWTIDLPMEHFVTLTEGMIALLLGTFTRHGPVDAFG